MSIKQRKEDHVSLTTTGEVDYTTSSGFEQYQLLHNALPEVNAGDVSTEASLMGRTFSFPLFISSMTGGFTEGKAVNAIIAQFCEKHNLPFGVGSQRIMLEKPSSRSSFTIVRETAPNAFIAANIGGAQLAEGMDNEDINRLLESIRADALIVHLNPLQELMQPEGDRKFKGIEEGIANLCSTYEIPVIVKETGAGISGDVAQRLLQAGVSVIDIAGSGGTSWAKVENERPSNPGPEHAFDDWGIPTVECLRQAHRLRESFKFELIASGGIRSSHDIAKSMCLNADFAAAAQPVIKAVVQEGMEGLDKLLMKWKKHLKIILTLLGCKKPSDLASHHLKLKSPIQ